MFLLVGPYTLIYNNAYDHNQRYKVSAGVFSSEPETEETFFFSEPEPELEPTYFSGAAAGAAIAFRR